MFCQPLDTCRGAGSFERSELTELLCKLHKTTGEFILAAVASSSTTPSPVGNLFGTHSSADLVLPSIPTNRSNSKYWTPYLTERRAHATDGDLHSRQFFHPVESSLVAPGRGWQLDASSGQLASHACYTLVASVALSRLQPQQASTSPAACRKAVKRGRRFGLIVADGCLCSQYNSAQSNRRVWHSQFGCLKVG